MRMTLFSFSVVSLIFFEPAALDKYCRTKYIDFSAMKNIWRGKYDERGLEDRLPTTKRPTQLCRFQLGKRWSMCAPHG